MKIKRVLSLLVALAIISATTACSGKVMTPLKPGDPAPQTRISLIDGDYVALSDYSGKTMVLFFWATTCSKSGQLLLKLKALANELSDRADIKFITISADKPDAIEKVKEKIHDLRLTSFVNAFSGNEGSDEAFLAYHCSEMPLVYVVGPDGNILGVGNTIEDVRLALGLN